MNQIVGSNRINKAENAQSIIAFSIEQRMLLI